MKSIQLIEVEWKFTPAKSCGVETYQTKYPRIWLQDTHCQHYFIGQSSLTALAVLWISEKLIFDMGIGFNWWK